MSQLTRRIDFLLERVRGGDALAFEELYYHLLPTVGAFVRSRTSRVAPVEDLVQEVFCRVWERRERFNGRCCAQTYVPGIAMNVVRQYYRISSRAISGMDLAHLSNSSRERTGDELDREEELQLLNRARLTLSAKQSQALCLAFDSSLSHRQAAQVAGCSEGAIRRRLEDARRNLRGLLNCGGERLVGIRRK